MSPWKILLLSYIEKYGEDKILYLKKERLESISDKLNPFWGDILLNLSELLPRQSGEISYKVRLQLGLEKLPHSSVPSS
jgi:hypothetical protein